MSAFYVLLVVSVATYRITRFVVRDHFPPVSVQRARVAERWGDRSWQAWLAQCSWCMSPYIAAAVVVGTDLVTSVPLPVLVWATASGVTGFMATREGPDEEEG